MSLRLKEISFNHSSSVTVDAFNIRKNERDFIGPPEWCRDVSRNPEDSPAAYARFETQGKTLTIKANFSFDGTGAQDVSIRALDANLHRDLPLNGPNLSPQEVELFETMVVDSEGNVLGEVVEDTFTLDPGDTGFQPFDLGSVRIWDLGVGVANIVWRWQFRVSGTANWIDFAITTHRIYHVLNIPTEPWKQQPYEPGHTQLPWQEVLEHACDWARDAQDRDQAASKITERLNDLGQKLICYAPVGATYYTDHLAFDCSSFLSLLSGGKGKGPSLNCDDCAAIVSTFANSVGCDLAQRCIRPIVGSAFLVKPHVKIGIEDPQVDTEFFHHTIAAEGCGDDVEVFDACVKIGGGPSIFMVPTNVPFSMGKSGYHFRLVEKIHQPIAQLHPACKRRPVGPATEYPDICTEAVALKEEFEFSSWETPDDEGTRIFVSEFFLADYIVSSAQLAELQASDPGTMPSSLHSLWRGPTYEQEKRFRIDAYENASRQEARQGVMKILGSLQMPGLARHHVNDLGEVTFAGKDFPDILFALGNLVFYLRDVCDEVGSLVEIGLQIAEKLRSRPPGTIEVPATVTTVKRFSFTSGDAVARKTITFQVEPPHLPGPKRLYQFFADNGEVFLENGQLVYLPATTGDHVVEIFAVDGQGNAILQRRKLTVNG